MKTGRRIFCKALAGAAAALGSGTNCLLRADAEQANIRFWDMQTGPPPWYGSAGQNLVEKFNAMNTGVRATYELESWDDWPQMFSLALSAGAAPDMSTGGSYQALQYYDAGEILALDDLVEDLKQSGEDRDFWPGTLEYMVYKGHTIALPWAIDLRAVYYRKDLFARAGIAVPTSWDEMREAARALTSPGQYGCVAAGSSLPAMQMLFLLMLNNAGGLFTADGHVDMMTDRNIEAFQFLSNLVKDGSANPGSPFDCEPAIPAGRSRHQTNHRGMGSRREESGHAQDDDFSCAERAGRGRAIGASRP